MKKDLLRLKAWVGKRLRRINSNFWQGYSEWKYRNYKQDHVFNIKIDDMAFKMSFNDYKLDFAIVERIEGIRELDTVAMIKCLLKKESKVLEIGGCYGYFTSIMALAAGNEGRIVSIEGTPNNYSILKNNIARNNFSNVQAYNMFIANNLTNIKFHAEAHNPYEAIKKSFDGEELKNGVAVPVKTISGFLGEIGFDPDYIFMDIEGFEVDVLEDLGNNYFNKNKPLIIFEIHPDYYKKNKGLDFLREFLKSKGYFCRRVSNNMVCFP